MGTLEKKSIKVFKVYMSLTSVPVFIFVFVIDADPLKLEIGNPSDPAPTPCARGTVKALFACKFEKRKTLECCI
jgi:hypothetical protein